MRVIDVVVPLLELAAFCALIALIAAHGPWSDSANVAVAVAAGVVLRSIQRVTGLTYLYDH